MSKTSPKSHTQKLVQQCEVQCHALANSTDHSLVELRNTIWCWPPTSPPPPPSSFEPLFHENISTKKIRYDNVRSHHWSPQNKPNRGGESDDKKISNSIGSYDIKQCRSSSLFAESKPPSEELSPYGLVHCDEEDDNWWKIQKKDNDDDDGCEIWFQLVVADLDITFIRACRAYFNHGNESSTTAKSEDIMRGGGGTSNSINLSYSSDGNSNNEKMRKGVRILHQPLQQAIADSVRPSVDEDWNNDEDDDDVHTFVVFGSYGSFPCEGENSNGFITGLCKSCIATLFPSSWENFALQCDNRHGGGTTSSSSSSRVWISSIDEIPNILTLVACEAYPRNQYPSEEEAAAQRWEMALDMIASRVGDVYPLSTQPSHSLLSLSSFSCARYGAVSSDDSTSASCSHHGVHTSKQNKIDPKDAKRFKVATTTKPKTRKKRKVRVITHAMGSFVGHMDVSVFAQGLANAMDRFSAKISNVEL